MLRVAEEHLGKQARCPSCSHVFTVTNAAPVPESTPPADVAANPFASSNQSMVEDMSNPYMAPSEYGDAYSSAVGEANWAPRQFLLEEVFQKSFQVFKKHWSMVCVTVLIVFAVNFGLSMLQNFVVQMITVQAGVAVSLAVQIITAFVLWIVQTWLGIGQIIVFLDIARGNEINLGKLFSGGPYLLQTLLVVVLVSLIMAVAGGVFLCIPALVVGLLAQNFEPAVMAAMCGFLVLLVPMVIVLLMFSQSQMLVIDRGLNGFEALQVSREITTGNKMQIFLVFLLLGVIGFVACVVGLLAFCFGIFPAMIGALAFGGLVFVVMYLCMTGQYVHVSEF